MPLVRALFMVPLLGAGLAACGEPPAPIGERTRSSPELVELGSCDEVAAAWKERLLEENRTSLLQQLRSSLGDVDDAPAPGDAFRDPLGPFEPVSAVPRGARPAALVSLPGGGQAVARLDAAGLELVEIDGDALEGGGSLSFESTPVGLVSSGDRILVVGAAGLRDPRTPDPAPDEPAPGFSVEQTELSLIEVAANGLALVRTLRFTGRVESVAPLPVSGAPRFVVSVAHAAPVTLRTWLEYDSSTIPFTGGVAAFERTVAANEAALSAVGPEVLLPEATVIDPDGEETDLGLVDEGCAGVLSAEDDAGTELLSLLVVGEAGAVAATHRLGAGGTTLGVGDDGDEGRILLAAPAQPGWWHWENDQHDPATNLHRLAVEDGAPEPLLSFREPGRLSPDDVAAWSEGLVVVTVLEEARLGDDLYSDEAVYGDDVYRRGPPRPGVVRVVELPFADGGPEGFDAALLDSRAGLWVHDQRALVASPADGPGLLLDLADGRTAGAAPLSFAPAALIALDERPLVVGVRPPPTWPVVEGPWSLEIAPVEEAPGSGVAGRLSVELDEERAGSLVSEHLRGPGAVQVDEARARAFLSLRLGSEAEGVRVEVVEAKADGALERLSPVVHDGRVLQSSPWARFDVPPALTWLTGDRLVVVSGAEVSLHDAPTLEELDRVSASGS